MNALLFFTLTFSLFVHLNVGKLITPSEMMKSADQSPSASVSAAKDGKTSDELGILPPLYYKDVAPVRDNQPVTVFVSVIILNLKLSSSAAQTLDVDIFFHNYWEDHRLLRPKNADALSHRLNLSDGSGTAQYKLDHSWANRIWTPDTYFRNADAGHISAVLTPTYYFTVVNQTTVFMAVRLSLRLFCRMNFAKFPFDVQRCFLNITSTSDEASILRLQWDEFRIGSHVDTAEFSIVSTDQSNNCTKQYDFGDFSCLYGQIVFRRNIGNYMAKKFIPSFIIVVMTFLGFWVPTSVSPARISLSVTALLALITQQIQSDLSVSYVYSLQVWNIVCIIFVFANLCEFALALFVMHMKQKRKAKLFRRMHSNQSNGASCPAVSIAVPNSKLVADSHNMTDERKRTFSSSQARYWQRVRTKIAKHFRSTSRHSWVDYVARYVFPLAFFLFVASFAAHSLDNSTNAFFI